MKKQLLYRAAATTVLALGLTTGVAAAQTPYQHYNNKHNSGHQVPTDQMLSSTNQQNNVSATNTATQVAQTGKAVVTDNKKASEASAKSGGAGNDSELTNAQVQVSNGGSTSSPAGSDTMGADNETPAPTTGSTSSSTKTVTSTNQQNNVTVSNNVDQYANTGDAVVAHNSQGGSATTGNASNKSTASFDISVTN